mgnify:FL=1
MRINARAIPITYIMAYISESVIRALHAPIATIAYAPTWTRRTRTSRDRSQEVKATAGVLRTMQYGLREGVTLTNTINLQCKLYTGVALAVLCIIQSNPCSGSVHISQCLRGAGNAV